MNCNLMPLLYAGTKDAQILLPPPALSREPFRLDSEEENDEEATPAAALEGSSRSDSYVVTSSSGTVQAHAAEDQDDLGDPIYAEVCNKANAEEPRQWYGRPLYRAILLASCVLALLLVLGVVVLVLYLTKTIGGQPASPVTVIPTPVQPQPYHPNKLPAISLGTHPLLIVELLSFSTTIVAVSVLLGPRSRARLDS